MSSFGAAAGGGADDDAAGEAVLLAEVADDAAQPGALFARFDLAGDADVVDRRHEDQEASGHRHVRGQAGALRAERLLDHLDEDLLPFLQEIFNLGLGTLVALARGRGPIPASRGPRAPLRRTAVARRRRRRTAGSAGVATARGLRRRSPAAATRPRRRLVLVAGLEPVELLDGVDDLGDVEERVALEADVNKGGLHAGQDLRDPPLVDIADNAALTARAR